MRTEILNLVRLLANGEIHSEDGVSVLVLPTEEMERVVELRDALGSGRLRSVESEPTIDELLSWARKPSSIVPAPEREAGERRLPPRVMVRMGDGPVRIARSADHVPGLYLIDSGEYSLLAAKRRMRELG